MKSTRTGSGIQPITDSKTAQVPFNSTEGNSDKVKTSFIQPCKFSGYGVARRLYRRLGTLGDPKVPGATCSEVVALDSGKARRVVSYGTFEDAAADVVLGRIDVFLVPAAYPQAFHFIHSAQLILVEVFVMRIPPLVVAGRSGSNAYGKKLFYHPATLPLLPEIQGQFDLALTVRSNAEACRAVLEEQDTLCITNSICAQKFGLTVFRVIRSGVLMPFLIFAALKPGKNSSNNN
jgi:hypothetical protein